MPLNAAKAGHNGSVPKMETSSNVINVELKTFLKKVLGNVCYVHWTDSECSLKSQDVKEYGRQISCITQIASRKSTRRHLQTIGVT